MTITLLHQGYDGLDMTIEGQIPPVLADLFESAREKAGAMRRPQLVTYKDVDFLAAESGAKGGFSYRCDTGPVGATWFFKKPRFGERWGIMVSWKSAPLTVSGAQACVEASVALLNRIGCPVTDTSLLLGRADYCLDYLLPDFVLKPAELVMHSRFRIHSDQMIAVDGVSDRVVNVRIGSHVNKQLAIYDKRREALQKHKLWLWDQWNGNLAKRGLPRIDVSNTAGRIWRVELRIGKKLFREKFQIKTPTDFFARAGFFYASVVNEIRHVTPTEDSNRARWPMSPLWRDVQARIDDGLSESIGVVPENRVKEVERAILRESLTAQRLGVEASLAVLAGYGENSIEETIQLLGHDQRQHLTTNREKLSAKIGDATGRYRFLD